MEEREREEKTLAKSINSTRSIWYSGFVQSNDRLLPQVKHQMKTQIEIEISICRAMKTGLRLSPKMQI